MKLSHSLITSGAIVVVAYIGVTAYGNYQVSLQPGKSVPVIVGTPEPLPNRVTVVENPATELKAAPITQEAQRAQAPAPAPVVHKPAPSLLPIVIAPAPYIPPAYAPPLVIPKTCHTVGDSSFMVCD